jgi:hypothetical protein
MWKRLHVKHQSFLSNFNKTWIFSTDSLQNRLNIKFRQNPSSGSQVAPRGRKNGRTDMTKLTIAFRNFANAPKSDSKFPADVRSWTWLEWGIRRTEPFSNTLSGTTTTPSPFVLRARPRNGRHFFTGRKTSYVVRFRVVWTETTDINVFRDVTPCTLVGRVTCWLHAQNKGAIHLPLAERRISLRRQPTLTDVSRGLPHFLQTNAESVKQTRQLPSPSTSFPIH